MALRTVWSRSDASAFTRKRSVVSVPKLLVRLLKKQLQTGKPRQPFCRSGTGQPGDRFVQSLLISRPARFLQLANAKVNRPNEAQYGDGTSEGPWRVQARTFFFSVVG